MNKKEVILSISGHDPSGGAGLQTDILTSNFFNFHCVSCLTCQTVQTTKKLFKLDPTKIKFFEQNIDEIVKGTNLSGIKVGVVPNKNIAKIIIKIISSSKIPIVIDPIFNAGGGGRFIEKRDLSFFRDSFYPYSSLLTPNIEELKILSNNKSEEDSIKFLFDKGIKNIYVTGKVKKNKIINSFYSNGFLIKETSSIYLKKNIHGTGCALSTAILCNLVNKKSFEDSCSSAHRFLSHLVKNSIKTKGQDILNFKK